MAGTIVYRFAHQSDEGAIAALHADSWRRSFRGLLPDRYLDEEIVDERAEAWRQRFADPVREQAAITIVAELDGEPVGFVHAVIDDDATWGSLLDNIHVRHDVQGRGIGRRLIGETAASLRARGRGSVHLRVLQANERARRLYDSLDGHAVEEDVWEFAGATIPSLRYAWVELDPLLACLPDDRAPLEATPAQPHA